MMAMQCESLSTFTVFSVLRAMVHGVVNGAVNVWMSMVMIMVAVVTCLDSLSAQQGIGTWSATKEGFIKGDWHL